MKHERFTVRNGIIIAQLTQSKENLVANPTEINGLVDGKEKLVPPAETTTQQITEAKPKDEETIKKEKAKEMLEISAKYLLSKIVEGNLHHEVFGNEASVQFKKIFMNAFSELLEKYWYPDPKSIEDMSEIERLIVEKCNILKRGDYTRREIIRSVSRTLGILPPKKYRYD
ncbi:MAG: hypothetical protein A3D74_00225 [Candidatus Levybacteria bacterium RIFCSPHIGHO2_02_FULL_37_13]|nr:MAG: hypothetical protein A3D74_00225 [Candidatus Levybacteria bacterium RIFCSPHIGHO2_02_FULL_37_13]OGH29739.1 MAG: hypothetical protein A3E40_02930 [Candidatus Levybacteria bacterium RIFCSPHIGHO2_12_FULL_37_9]OGH39408.1 MAG: hypothetical protein A3B41_01410 [Candidatus Levybacteria bacterium RIFCSPLOWO2_01_FULL_37_26]